ncbi:hypothetical protein VNI00_002144 [Paramarasmius palmivorus]|uniref:Agmatinase n=1 Tax=Paramarasmius palmivorus TaxID=297713 RepID=A0AAW0E4B9_9AGAR
MRDHLTPLIFLGISTVAAQQQPLYAPGVSGATWREKYGPQTDLTFTGPNSFSHLPYVRCLDVENEHFDIAILGMPFDTGVTHRPGARFGPQAIRTGSQREFENFGYSLSWETTPYEQGAKIIDCGDVPVSPFDNALAIDQMEVAYSTLLDRPVANSSLSGSPRIITLGGDHTIVLPILRALHKVHGPISVIHFDSHLDTWPTLPGSATKQSRINHGTYFYVAHEEGLISNHSIHAGIRGKLMGLVDLETDASTGFQLISTDDIDNLGIPEIHLPVSVDDEDPNIVYASFCKAGTPEAGGWTTREVKRIIRGLAGLNFVGADIVEVAPAYDHAEITGIAAADLVYDFLSMMLTDEPPKNDRVRDEL